MTLGPAHRSWRLRIFAATWLTYVGFYFCRKPLTAAKSAMGADHGWDAITLGNIYAAYLVAYAAGQFLASVTGPRFGPRRNVLAGMILSIAVTLAIAHTPVVAIAMALAATNGLAQATGWSGTVGTMGSWFHHRERGRVMGLWSTNFVVGSIASGLVMGAVLEEYAWETCFYLGAAILAFVAAQFVVFQRDRPEDVGLSPVHAPAAVAAEQPPEPPDVGLTRAAWTNLLLVGGFYFCSKLVRYAVWSWSAYLLTHNFAMSDAQANRYSIVFDVCGIPGIYLTGWISDRYFGSRRAGIALVMMIAMCIATGLLTRYGTTDVTTFVILLGAVGFTLFGPDALLSGAGAMDIGGRRAATFATAVIAGFGALGPIVQEVVIPRLYDQKAATTAGNLGPVFAVLFATALLGTLFCAVLAWRNARGGKGI